jgi:hypothetical protein
MSNNSTYYNRKAAGLCPFCAKPATRGTIRCDECREKHSQATLAKYHKTKSAGICRYCASPAVEGKHLCESHFEEARKYDNERKEYKRLHRRQLRADALEMYGNSCQDCGVTPPKRLELHHVDGSGRIERTTRTGKNAGGHRLHERLRREGRDPNIVLLCLNCHRNHHLSI